MALFYRSCMCCVRSKIGMELALTPFVARHNSNQSSHRGSLERSGLSSCSATPTNTAAVSLVRCGSLSTRWILQALLVAQKFGIRGASSSQSLSTAVSSVRKCRIDEWNCALCCHPCLSGCQYSSTTNERSPTTRRWFCVALGRR